MSPITRSSPAIRRRSYDISMSRNRSKKLQFSRREVRSLRRLQVISVQVLLYSALAIALHSNLSGDDRLDQGIPFLDLVSPHVELESELTEVFQSAIRNAGFIGGPVVEQFEKAFAKFCATEYCIGA